MIPPGFGFEAGVPGRTRAPLSGHPATELRVGAHKGAAHVGRNPIVVYPSPIEHVTHTPCSFQVFPIKIHGSVKSKPSAGMLVRSASREINMPRILNRETVVLTVC